MATTRHHPGPATVITDAREGASRDLAQRQRRYLLAMGFRVVCFIGMIFVPGWPRWAMFGAAVVLPYAAVLIANQANERKIGHGAVEHGEPEPAPQITSGHELDVPGETADLDDEPLHTGNHSGQFHK